VRQSPVLSTRPGCADTGGHWVSHTAAGSGRVIRRHVLAERELPHSESSGTLPDRSDCH
jgi:hypothetical protein